MKFSLSDSFVCCRLHRISYYVGMKLLLSLVSFYNRIWLPSSLGAEIKSWAQDMSSAVQHHIQPSNLSEIYSNVIDPQNELVCEPDVS